MVLLGVALRVALKGLPKRERQRFIEEMNETLTDLIGSPARVIRLVEPASTFDDARVEAAAYWAAIRLVVERDGRKVKPPPPLRI